MRQLYFNGTIITMEAHQAEAVLCEEGKIKKLGTYEELKEQAGTGCEWIDLQGKCMMPAFLDTHSHMIGYAFDRMQVSLEGAKTEDEVCRRIREYIQKNHVKNGEWIKANAYDHQHFANRSYLSMEQLDRICPEHPLVIKHNSGHVGLMNHRALEELGVSVYTPQPEGGKIGKCENGLSGYLEESAFIELQKKIPMESAETIFEAIENAQKSYAVHGITTIQEGMIVKEVLPLLRNIIEAEKLKLDYVGYIDPNIREVIFTEWREYLGKYHKHFKIAGYKIFLDGSPQNKTAWMKTPYADGTNGQSQMSDEQVKQICIMACEDKMQLIAHCNGSAACKQFIDAYEQAYEQTKQQIHPVLIHAQFVEQEDLEKAKRLGMIPSFFIGHVYYYGEVHLHNLDKSIAERLSPAKSAQKLELPFTFHTDTPVTEPNLLESVWCAVNRQTREGRVLGAQEKIDVMSALKAITLHAAMQYGEEKEKGSIAEGKRADFVILDKNPLFVEPCELKQIKVLETRKNGHVLAVSP